MKRILICGSRDWTSHNTIKSVLSNYSKEIIVITGGCRGADTIAENVAKNLGMTVQVFNADWKKYGPSAGPIRNQKMLEEKPDLVIAFHENLDNSKGTKDMVNRARKAGIEIMIVST